MDLAIGGTRWTKRRETELDQLLKARAIKDGTFQKLRNGLKCNGQWVKTEHVIEYAAAVPEGDMGKLIFQAEAKATRYVNQAAQFGMELAQSGARHRAVRAIMQIGQYTQAQLEDPFVVIRSRFDWEAMREHLGDEMVKRLKAARAAQSMGLPEAVVAGLLTAPVAAIEELAEVGDKLTEPQAMSAEVAMADLFDDAPPVLNGAEDTPPLEPASEPAPSTERPYDAATVKAGLLSRVARAGNVGPATDKQVRFLARKFAEAFAPTDDAKHKYHTSLAALTGVTSANDLSFSWAKALLDWLLGGNKPDSTGDTPLSEFAYVEAWNVYRQAMKDAGQTEMELGGGGDD